MTIHHALFIGLRHDSGTDRADRVTTDLKRVDCEMCWVNIRNYAQSKVSYLADKRRSRIEAATQTTLGI